MGKKTIIVAFFLVIFIGASFNYECSAKTEVKKTYYPNGVLESQTPYNEEGLIDGKVKKYYETADLMAVIPYKNGIKQGVEKTYWETGDLQAAVPYNSNRRDGKAQYYDLDGNLVKEVIWENGRMAEVKKHPVKIQE